MWEVTSIDRDSTASNAISSSDEAEIELQDAVTGNSVTVDLDAQDDDANNFGNSGDYYAGEEVIDGQTYKFVLEGNNDHFTSADADDDEAEFRVVWGSNTDVPMGEDDDAVDSGVSTGAQTLYAPVDTTSGSSVALTEEVALTGVNAAQTYELPTTQSTDKAVVNITSGSSTLNVSGVQGITAASDAAADGDETFTVRGGTTYTVEHVADGEANISVDGEKLPAAVVTQPEDDSDQEKSFILEASNYDSDDGYNVGGSSAVAYSEGLNTVSLESDSEVYQGFTGYGSFVERDSNDQGETRVHIPSGQSTAGVAVTGPEGEISSEGGGGSATVESSSPTGWSSNAVALDSDNTVSSAKQDSNLILVGGPAANSLVSELASENKTWEASQYTEGQGMLQLVEDAFYEGHDALVVAGYSGEDTRQAGAYLTNYEQNSEELEGSSQVSINTAEGTVVQ